MSELKDKAVKGVFWSATEQLSVQGLQFVFGLVIARMVSPSEYGLIAMLTIFIAVAQVFVDSGFSSVLVQKVDKTEEDFSTVFYFNIFVAIIAYFTLFCAAPYISDFYHQIELIDVLRIVSLSLILNSLVAIHRIKYTIALNFKVLAIISFISAIISGTTGVVMASMDYGVWSLVGVNIVGNIVTTLLLLFCSKWKPTFNFSFKSFKSLFAFGSKIVISGLLRTIYHNIYTLVIGYRYNAADVGYFNRANSLAIIFSGYIVLILEKVSFPVLCSLQNERDRLSVIFNKLIAIVWFVVFPIISLLFILAHPLIELVLTEKWLPAAPLLQLICIACTMTSFIDMNSNILNTCGRSDYFLRSEIIKKIFGIVVLFVTMPFGLVWLCVGMIISNIISTIVSVHYSKKVVDTSLWLQLKSVSKIFCASILMVCITWVVSWFIDPISLKIIAAAAAGIVSYFIAAKVLKIQELEILVAMAKSVIRR